MNKNSFLVVALTSVLAFAASSPTAEPTLAPVPIASVGSALDAGGGSIDLGNGSAALPESGSAGAADPGGGDGTTITSAAVAPVDFCVLSDHGPESTGDGEFEYTGDELGCADYEPLPILDLALDDAEAEVVELFAVALHADGKKAIDNRVTDAAKIEKARENHTKHGELVAKNKERISSILEKPADMPPTGEKNPLGVTFERFKLAVEGGPDGTRVALHFRDTPAAGKEPARTAKENQEKMAAELKEAMRKINERLQNAGQETLGDFQFVIIGSGTTFFSNNHTKALAGGEPKVFGQKTTSLNPVKNEAGTRKDLDMDIQLTCPGMVDYVADKPHELNDKITRYLGPDNAVYNLFKSSGDKGILSKHFPELQEVVTRWTTLLEIGEVDIKLVTDTTIGEVGSGAGPILLVGGP